MEFTEAEYYIQSRFQIIPLHPGTKIPMQKSWNDGWNSTEVLEFFRDPEVNCGLRLGKIVDVEGDSVAANHLLDEIIGDYAHPHYKSSKSTHHLFLNPDPKLTRVVVGDVEFRGHRHFSMLPPSRHPNGTIYQWEVPPGGHNVTTLMKLMGIAPTTGALIPEMPVALRRFYYKNRGKGEWVKPDRSKATCRLCTRQVYVDTERLDREMAACRLAGSSWVCPKCRGKMGIEIRSTCRRMR